MSSAVSGEDEVSGGRCSCLFLPRSVHYYSLASPVKTRLPTAEVKFSQNTNSSKKGREGGRVTERWRKRVGKDRKRGKEGMEGGAIKVRTSEGYNKKEEMKVGQRGKEK